jgi:hypothetical protein
MSVRETLACAPPFGRGHRDPEPKRRRALRDPEATPAPFPFALRKPASRVPVSPKRTECAPKGSSDSPALHSALLRLLDFTMIGLLRLFDFPPLQPVEHFREVAHYGEEQ